MSLINTPLGNDILGLAFSSSSTQPNIEIKIDFVCVCVEATSNLCTLPRNVTPEGRGDMLEGVRILYVN